MIRGTTLIHSLRCALSEVPTHLRTLTQPNASQHTEEILVLCALSGPFDELKSVLLSALQNSLWDQASPLSPSHRFLFFLFIA